VLLFFFFFFSHFFFIFFFFFSAFYLCYILKMFGSSPFFLAFASSVVPVLSVV